MVKKDASSQSQGDFISNKTFSVNFIVCLRRLQSQLLRNIREYNVNCLWRNLKALLNANLSCSVSDSYLLYVYIWFNCVCQ